jgi:hypothetical protein
MFSKGSFGAVPVTARRAKREKRGSRGGSPRKRDDLLTGPSGLFNAYEPGGLIVNLSENYPAVWQTEDR